MIVSVIEAIPTIPRSGQSDASYAQVAFYEILYRGNPSYAHYLHTVNAEKPYSACMVDDRLRVGLLDYQVSQAFTAGMPIGSRIAFHAPISSLFRDAEPMDEVTMAFVTPTAFRLDGHWHALPEPVLVFGGLKRRWDGCGGCELPHLDPRRVTVKALDLHTEMVQFSKPGGEHYFLVGFVGQVTWRLWSDDEMKRAFAALGRFAIVSGVGARTGMGMGQVRLA